MESIPIWWEPSQPTCSQGWTCSETLLNTMGDPEGTASAVWHRTISGDSAAGDEEGWETGVWLLPVRHCRAGQAARSFCYASSSGKN